MQGNLGSSATLLFWLVILILLIVLCFGWWWGDPAVEIPEYLFSLSLSFGVASGLSFMG